MGETIQSVTDHKEKYGVYFQVIEEDSDDILEIHGYARNCCKTAIYYITSILTLGCSLLIFHWKPTWKIYFTCNPCNLSCSEFLLIKDCHGMFQTTKVQIQDLARSSPLELMSSTQSSDEDMSESNNLVPRSQFKFFTYNFMKFFWDNKRHCFRKLRGLDTDVPCEDFSHKFLGITEDERDEKQMLYGPNLIDIKVKSYGSLLIDEVLNPFYIFQLASIILWSCDDYYYYASCIFIISMISIGVSLYEIKKQMITLKDMVSESNALQVTVLQLGKSEPEVIPAALLVPGDILIIPPNGCLMSCDAVLTAGNCIVNEAMLTGESVPETKTPITHYDETYNPTTHKRHTLFCGTKVIQTRFYGNNHVTAVVVRTGFLTSKGELVRSILFPKPMGFQFYKDSIRFIVLLFIVAAFGMTYSLYLYISRGAPTSQTILKVLDIITIVVPPALPAALTVGTVYAQGRLKTKGIFCISPPRINVAGKIKLMCFDKTGTLTEEGLDFFGLLPVVKNSFKSLLKDLRELPRENPVLAAMATCHSLTMIDGKLAGDPLDQKMFDATNWVLEEPGDDNTRYDMLMPTVVRPPGNEQSLQLMDSFPIENGEEKFQASNSSIQSIGMTTRDIQSGVMQYEVGIIRQFPFSSSLQRMSVICRTLGSNHMDIYAKGSPEKIQSLCLPHTLPDDFNGILSSYTLEGFRVLALAYKPLSSKFSWRHAQRAKREEVESDLIFLGMIIMQNALKPETTPVITTLNKAAIRLVMVTGDNLLTALSVARECGLVSNHNRIIVVKAFENDAGIPRIQYEATGKSDRESKAILSDGSGAYQTIDIDLKRDISFVCDGKSYNVLRTNFPEEFLKVIVRGAIFARMSPDQKTHLVESLQSLGYVVGMCGDGANDCGALKAADIGISLSEAEASVAAPFTSNISNIECVPVVMKEGRCAMATSFSLFKFIALYSLIQFVSVLILYRNGSNLGDPMFLYIDLAIITSLAIVMGNTQAYPRLVPKRPISNLISINNVASMLLQFILIIVFQIGTVVYLFSQKWYKSQHGEGDDLVIVCWESTTIFLISSFQYLIVAMVYSKGPPYRQPFYTNVSYLITLIVLTSFTLLLLFSPWMSLSTAFQLMTWRSNKMFTFQYTLALLASLNTALAILAEFFIAQSSFLKTISHFVTQKKLPKNKYKIIERDIVQNFTLDES